MNINQKTRRRIISALLVIAAAASGFGALAAEGGVDMKNSAPIAENIELATYKNVSVSGRLSAMDPDGDAVRFAVKKEPKKGSVELCDGGEFVYTPYKNKKGTDSFTYVAFDAFENVSAEAAVSIKIKSQSTDVCYADMDGNSAHYDAICLAENGIFIGERIGTSYFFSPEATVTRSEFLAMCMTMCGVENLDDITKTGFADDAAIPAWSKPYVATALTAGIVRGYRSTSGNIVFSADAPISYSEAVVILDNVLDITDVSAGAFDAECSCPAWAYQSASNLASCRIITDVGAAGSTAVMTRADAAKMLSASIDVLESRPKRVSLFGWIR